MRPVSTLLCVAILALAVDAGLAADSGWSTPTQARSDMLSGARVRIGEKDWRGSISELHRVNDQGNADWNSLMGYSLSKQDAPDYEAAEWYFDQALRIQPHHFTALGYLGELFLMKGSLPKAERQLLALANACELACEEYRQLKAAIDRYKAAGNRYVSLP